MDDVVNCFGDIETADNTDGFDDQELIVIGGELTQDRLDRQVEAIHLVGSFISGCHQELRFLLHQRNKNCSNGSQKTAFLRISRVNGTDTFQLEDEAQSSGADVEDLPTLLVLDTFPQTITLHDVKAAFDQTRNLMKRYDQGDCHALSQMICDLLVPGSFPAELDW